MSSKTSKDTVEGYLRDVPEGLYPQRVIMTDKERKSLFIRRLEQPFTGRGDGAYISKTPPMWPGGSYHNGFGVHIGVKTDEVPDELY